MCTWRVTAQPRNCEGRGDVAAQEENAEGCVFAGVRLDGDCCNQADEGDDYSTHDVVTTFFAIRLLETRDAILRICKDILVI